MKELFEKIDWKKFRIRSKRDWIIFWIFAVLICYAAGSEYGNRIGNWLFRFSNPYMMNLNQPHSWGQLMGFLFVLAAVTEAVLFLCRKSVKAKILVLAGALLMPMVIVAGYRIHTNLIVSSLWKEEPAGVNIHYYTGADREHHLIRKEELTEEEWQELIELCRNLKPVSDGKAQEELMQWYLEDTQEHFMYVDDIDLHFDEKYGHNYSFWIKIYDGKIYLWRGYSSSKAEITFFEDNGITGWLEEIKGRQEE